MLVSGIAAASGSPGLSIGNALGSNITNISLVLGVAALAAPITVHSKILRREVPVLLLTMLLSYALVFDGTLSQLDGVVLIAGMCFMVTWVVAEGLRESKKGEDPLSDEFEAELPDAMSTGKAVFWLILGLVVLLGSARLVVWGASTAAGYFGVSDLVIGLTVVAIGTSLPELAASVVSSLKGEDDIAIGNVIGSNMFNLLGVLALPGLISPGPVEPAVISRDFPAMIGLTFLFYLLARGLRVRARLNRFNGALLVLGFVLYLALVFIESVTNIFA